MEKVVFVTDDTIRKCMKKKFDTIKKVFFGEKDLGDFCVSIYILMNPNKKIRKSPDQFTCEKCDYITHDKKDYKKHLDTRKHKILTNPNEINPKNPENPKKCECGKIYKHASSLSSHKKKCSNILAIEKNDNDNFVIDKEFVMMIIKQNAELQTNVLELMKKGTHNTNSQNNNNNKTFNLQFFLNETCKDAMNIMDFVDSIKPTLEDLENTGKVGYVECISKIIVDNLKELETCERPIHCSNIKKEVLYIKDQDKWTQEKPVLTKAIHTIANKNINNINEWKEENPGCKESVSTKNDAYLNIVMNSMAGSSTEETSNNMNKIITNVAKEVVIDK